METFSVPNGRCITVPSARIMTFGLSKAQNETVREHLPTKNVELYDTDVVTDLIAIQSEALIIGADSLDSEGMKLIFDYYSEIIDSIDESIFWIGYPKPPSRLRSKFKCYQNFEELLVNLRYCLLDACRKSKKSRDFSKKLADSLTILSLIRSQPGIRTKELAERLELSRRTVQRYIAALQATGEWIEYDFAKRGWKLQYGISVLFGDHLTEDEGGGKTQIHS